MLLYELSFHLFHEIVNLPRETWEESTTFLRTACRAVKGRPGVATEVDSSESSELELSDTTSLPTAQIQFNNIRSESEVNDVPRRA